MQFTVAPSLRHTLRSRTLRMGMISSALGLLACSSTEEPGAGLFAADASGVSSSGGVACVVPSEACNGGCVDLASDPGNCGGCGLACVVGQTCQAGVCTNICSASQTVCGTTCADITANALHCGACNLSCGAGQICQNGACVVGSCPPGQTLCAGACVDLAVDNLNCGSCGAACLVGAACETGVCGATACPAGQLFCNGVCTDVTTASNCGSCGNACSAGQLCSNGSCVGSTSGALTSGAAGSAAQSVTSTSTTATASTSTGAGGASMTSTTASTASTAATTGGANTDPRPWFSFFVTSLPGLQEECGQDGCGGDLGGLSGADAICARLAQQGNPGDTKTWRAFLSTTGMYGDMLQVDAIDRVGSGPWWDWHGRMLAPDIDSLSSTRPAGGDGSLRVMFVDETGADIQSARNGDGAPEPDNHDSLTGSSSSGRLAMLQGDDGTLATCEDWTSSTLTSSAMGGGGGGRVPVGHAWPRQAGSVEGNGSGWIQDHTVNGCEPSVQLGSGGGACSTCFGVGDGGGYGAFYCFALEATAPPQ